MQDDKVPEGFKMTEVGLLPENWEVNELREAVKLIMGQSPPGRTYNEYGNGMPFLQGKAEFGSIYPSHVKYTTRPLKIASEGSILISIRAPVGDVNIADIEYCIGRGLASLSLKTGCNVFLFYLMMFLKHDIEEQGTGSTFKAINKSRLGKFRIPLPPLPEQRKIAEILSTVDDAIQKADEAIAKTERLKKGLMQELLTKGIGHKEFKDTEIGRIPKEWEVVRLSDVSLDFFGGGTPSTSNPDYWNGDIPWMTSAHINGRLVTNGQRYITKHGLGNSATNLVPKGNLLVSTRVGIGKIAVNEIDIAISQDLTGVIVDKTKAIPDFLYWYFANIEKRLKALSQGSTIMGILREDLAKLRT